MTWLSLVVQRTVRVYTTEHPALPRLFLLYHLVPWLQMKGVFGPASLRYMLMSRSYSRGFRSPPPPLNGLAYCFNHSSDSQTVKDISKSAKPHTSEHHLLARLPVAGVTPFVGLAMLTFKIRPRSSFMSMLSIASCASPADEYVTKA